MSDRTDWGPDEDEAKFSLCSILWFINAALGLVLLGNFFLCLCAFIIGAGYVMRGND